MDSLLGKIDLYKDAIRGIEGEIFDFEEKMNAAPNPDYGWRHLKTLLNRKNRYHFELIKLQDKWNVSKSALECSEPIQL